MARQGLNTTLSYSYAKTTYKFSVRTAQVAFGSQMVAGESQARTRRAYYPHQVSSVPFQLTLILNGYNERVAFSNYISDYITRVQDPSLSVSSFPTVQVTIPTRKFLRWGVPISGIAWGDHVGSMVWTPTVVFETHIDQSLGDTPGDYKWVSYYELDKSAIDQSPEIKYFYPSGTQLSGNQVPDPSAYDKVTSIQTIQEIISGGTKGGSDPGDIATVPYAPGKGPNSPFQITPGGPVGH